MKKKALVVVLGELARSPRMQYHCISLARNDYDVTVIANGDNSKGYEKLESNQNIKKKLMPDTIDFKKFLPSFVAYLFRPIWQALLIIKQLLSTPIPHVIILQNPPSIPTLPLLYLYARLFGSRLIVDWHNYGFSILKLSLGPNHMLVRIYTQIEVFFGRLADAGFCVSAAMKTDLIDSFKITYPLFVLYDKPPSLFKPLTLNQKHEFFLKIKEILPAFKSESEDRCDRSHTPEEQTDTQFTMTSENPPHRVIARPNRPAIVLSSTSWTEDEDFDLLLDALQLYEERLRTLEAKSNPEGCHLDGHLKIIPDDSSKDTYLPKLICVITGKGPLKAHYEEKISRMELEHIKIVLPWLSAEDYIKMVGSCDVGISLHSSSSGVDLPMKVVDLFGCGVPVLAYKYAAINELVKDEIYGRTFRDSSDLFRHIVDCLKNFHLQDCSREDLVISPLGQYRKNIIERFLSSRWEDNWKKIAKPVFDQLSR